MKGPAPDKKFESYPLPRPTGTFLVCDHQAHSEHKTTKLVVIAKSVVINHYKNAASRVVSHDFKLDREK